MASELKNKTAKGLVWGGTFSLLQQLLSLLFGIIIARILSPSDYGMVGLLVIFISIAGILQESGFVFVLTNRPSISRLEYSSVFWFNVIMSFFVYILLYVSAPYIAAFYGKDNLTALSRYVFLGFFISSFGIVQSAYLYRQMKVKEKGIATVISLIIAGLTGFYMAKNGYAYWGLATQGLVASLVSTIVLWFFSPFRPKFAIDVKFLKEVLPDGIRFALPNFVVSISGNMYTLILGKYYTVRDVGFFSQAAKFNTYGSSVTLNMLRNVSQPMLVQVKNNREECLKAFRKLVRFTVFVSFPSMLGLSLVAPELIYLILTPKWLFSAYILRIICIGGAFTALNTLFTYYFASQNMSSLYMWLGISVSTFRIPLAVIASFGGVMTLAYVCTAYDVIIVTVYYLFSKKSLGYSLKMFMADALPILLVVISALIFAYYSTKGIENIYILLISKIIIVSFIFITALHFLRFDIYMETRDIFLKYVNRLWMRICK